jgi:hypothetical protein
MKTQLKSRTVETCRYFYATLIEKSSFRFSHCFYLHQKVLFGSTTTIINVVVALSTFHERMDSWSHRQQMVSQRKCCKKPDDLLNERGNLEKLKKILPAKSNNTYIPPQMQGLWASLMSYHFVTLRTAKVGIFLKRAEFGPVGLVPKILQIFLVSVLFP